MRILSHTRLSGIICTVLLLGLVLAACGAQPAPAPVPAAPTVSAPVSAPSPQGSTKPIVPTPTGLIAPTAAPTGLPASTAEPTPGPRDDLARARSTGMLRVATSLDNPPFSTVNDQLQPDGLDIALITELARRVGLRVAITDFAFDHLEGALANNEADVAIAAISITPERADRMDFTNAYYAGQDGILAAPNSSIEAVRSVDDLAKLRVGVQKGTVYETWLQENAVKAGKMPADHLLVYPAPDAAVDALAAGEIDVFVLDRQPARTFASEGRAKKVGEQLYPQVYGIAVRKGSNLQPELNRVLAEAQKDGTVKTLVAEYLNVVPADVLPATPTSVPLATSTP